MRRQLTLLLAVVVSLCGAAPGGSAGIEAIAPHNSATLTVSDLVLCGRVKGRGTGEVKITLNGSFLESVPVQAGTFSTVMSLRPGANRIIMEEGLSKLELTYYYRVGEGIEEYRYHAAYGEGGCRECHTPGARWEMPGRQKELCNSCHDRKDTADHLHGPVAAGQCTFCHDPHGSSNPLFLKDLGRNLCLNCHNQSSSEGHVSQDATNDCLGCHDPHGSEKRFFLIQARP